MDSEGNDRCLIGDRYIEETSSCRDSYDGLLLCYESGPIPSDCSAISFLQGIMSRAGIEDISIEGLICRGLLIRMGNNILVTNAFEMLTSNRGGPVIKCALFPDDMAIEFLDHAVYDGSILDQIEDACRFVRRNVRCAGVVRGLYRTDTYDVPMDAVREAIVNAVVHRDYLLFGMDVFVSVFPDRVVVQSPGSLSVSIDGMKGGMVYRRNPVLYSFLCELGVTGSSGSGYRVMLEACDGLGVPGPVIEERKEIIRVTLFRRNWSMVGCRRMPRVNETEYRMLELFMEDSEIGRKEAAEILGISVSYLSDLICTSKDRGVLTRDGRRRSGGWKVNERMMRYILR